MIFSKNKTTSSLHFTETKLSIFDAVESFTARVSPQITDLNQNLDLSIFDNFNPDPSLNSMIIHLVRTTLYVDVRYHLPTQLFWRPRWTVQDHQVYGIWILGFGNLFEYREEDRDATNAIDSILVKGRRMTVHACKIFNQSTR